MDAILGKTQLSSVVADLLTPTAKHHFSAVDFAKSMPLLDAYGSRKSGIAGLHQFESVSKQFSSIDWASKMGVRSTAGALVSGWGGSESTDVGSNLLGPRDTSKRLAEAMKVSVFPSTSAFGQDKFDIGLAGMDAILGKTQLSSVVADLLTPTAKHHFSAVDFAKSMPLLDAYGSRKSGIAGLHQFESVSKQFSSIDWASKMGVRSTAGALDLTFGFGSLGDWVRATPPLFLRLRKIESELANLDPACSRLAVLLNEVGAAQALAMMERMIEEGASPLVEMLGAILLDREAIEALEEIVRGADLPDHAKGDLLHALQHLGEGSTDHALPPLVNGLEGALRYSARVRGDRKRRASARAVAAVLGMKKDHELLIQFVYDHVNDGRHGGELDRREASVFALVGLVLWMDEFLDYSGVEWLGRELDQRLGALAVAGG